MVYISQGNTKLGRIPSVSLDPHIVCKDKGLPCFKLCYANKAYLKTARKTWRNNTNLYTTDPNRYFESIYGYLLWRKPKLFRWHVAGDIPDMDYLDKMVEIANKLPDIKFLCFTKRYWLLNNYEKEIPHNLVVVFSSWPNLEIDNPKGFRVAWLYDENDDRIPNDAVECFGSCEQCGVCWNLPSLGKDILLHLH